MTTARDIIKKALQKNGVLTKGESPSGDEAVDGLFSLNSMVSSWSNDNLLIYSRVAESFPLTSSSTYTMGEGGDFNTVRPLKIDSVFVRQDSIDYPVRIINAADFDMFIWQKNIQSIPYIMTTDNGYPLNTLVLYPVPSSIYDIHFRSQKPLAEFATLDTDVDLPSGWVRALIYNLSIELASEYGVQVDQTTYQIAQDSINSIKTATAKNRPLDSYPSVGSISNIYTGFDR